MNVFTYIYENVYMFYLYIYIHIYMPCRVLMYAGTRALAFIVDND